MGLIITNHNLEKDASHATPKLTYYLFFFGTKITTYYSGIILNSTYYSGIILNSTYYSGIILNSFCYLLFSKLCWHNPSGPTLGIIDCACASHPTFMITELALS